MFRRFKSKVGDHRKRGVVPLRLRNPFIPRELGGSEGWRGPGWATIRLKVLESGKNRSSISGFTKEQGNGLQVDHIQPFRFGGRNRLHNLRVTDMTNNAYADLSFGSRERKVKRDYRW